MSAQASELLQHRQVLRDLGTLLGAVEEFAQGDDGNRSKCHLLVDGRGVPLSIIVATADVNDGERLDAVLSAIVVKRKRPVICNSKHLCADAGYRSAENMGVIDDHGHMAHVVDRRKDIGIK